MFYLFGVQAENNTKYIGYSGSYGYSIVCFVCDYHCLCFGYGLCQFQFHSCLLYMQIPNFSIITENSIVYYCCRECLLFLSNNCWFIGFWKKFNYLCFNFCVKHQYGRMFGAMGNLRIDEMLLMKWTSSVVSLVN